VLADGARGALEPPDPRGSFLRAPGYPLHGAGDPAHALRLLARAVGDLGRRPRGTHDRIREPPDRRTCLAGNRPPCVRPAAPFLDDRGSLLDGVEDLGEDLLHLGGGVLGPVG